MRARMGSELWEEWLAFMETEPVGGPAQDLRLAYALAAIGNVVGGGKLVTKDRRVPYQIADFLLRYEARGSSKPKKEKRLSPEETRRYVAGIMSAYGGIDPKYPNARADLLRQQEG